MMCGSAVRVCQSGKAIQMNPDKILLMICAVIGFGVGAIVGNIVGVNAAEMRAVKQGAAQYNPQTAAFEWITSKEPERDYVTEVHNQMIMNRLNNQKCE
jgi:hypothetical protein